MVQTLDGLPVLSSHLSHHGRKDPCADGDFRLMDRKVVNVLSKCVKGIAFHAACQPGSDLNRLALNTNVPHV